MPPDSLAQPLVRVSDVVKLFGAAKVLDGVSFTVARGQTVAVIGRSGAGKSTLLRCISGLEAIQGGEIEICGHRVGLADRQSRKALRRDVGIVFQSYNLFPHLTVERNITLALMLVQKKSRREACEIAVGVLGLVGLANRLEAYPDQLSGGQQQRVAIARSLALSPQVMLFDEITSALDPELTAEVLTVIEDLAKRGMTMILVTHEMGFAHRIANLVLFMHEGKVWESGPIGKVFASPRTSELRKFLASVLAIGEHAGARRQIPAERFE